MSILGTEKAYIVITGNEHGFGLALTKRLLSMGHEVIAVGRNQVKLDEAKAACPGLCTIQADLLGERSRASLVTRILSEFPKVNVLINNAGINNSPYPLSEITDRDWTLEKEEFLADFVVPMHMTTMFLPHLMTKDFAAIINVTSILAFTPYAPFSTYSAAKASLHSFTQSTRTKVKGLNIRVAEIIPPVFETDAAPSTTKETMQMEAFADYALRELHAGTEEIAYRSGHIVRGTRDELDRLSEEWSNKGGVDVFLEAKPSPKP